MRRAIGWVAILGLSAFVGLFVGFVLAVVLRLVLPR